jgi:hypothetical protein
MQPVMFRNPSFGTAASKTLCFIAEIPCRTRDLLDAVICASIPTFRQMRYQTRWRQREITYASCVIKVSGVDSGLIWFGVYGQIVVGAPVSLSQLSLQLQALSPAGSKRRSMILCLTLPIQVIPPWPRLTMMRRTPL